MRYCSSARCALLIVGFFVTIIGQVLAGGDSAALQGDSSSAIERQEICAKSVSCSELRKKLANLPLELRLNIYEEMICSSLSSGKEIMEALQRFVLFEKAPEAKVLCSDVQTDYQKVWDKRILLVIMPHFRGACELLCETLISIGWYRGLCAFLNNYIASFVTEDDGMSVSMYIACLYEQAIRTKNFALIQALFLSVHEIPQHALTCAIESGHAKIIELFEKCPRMAWEDWEEAKQNALTL